MKHVKGFFRRNAEILFTLTGAVLTGISVEHNTSLTQGVDVLFIVTFLIWGVLRFVP